MPYFDSIKQVNKDASLYTTWYKAQRDNESKRQFLHKTTLPQEDEVNLSYERGRVVIDAINTVDNYTDNINHGFGVFNHFFNLLGKAKDIFMKFAPELGFSIGGILSAYYARVTKTNNPKLNTFFIFLPLIATFATTTASYFLSSKVKNEVSNMIKFQARKNELKDLDNFIIYTKEQIEEAQKIANNIESNKGKSFKNLKDATESAITAKNMFKDRAEYKEDKERKELESNKKHNVIEKAFHFNKLDQAKKDQELLHKIFRDLNIKTVDYEEKAKEAANLVTVTKTAMGAIAGGIMSLGLNKIETYRTLTPALTKLKTIGIPAGALIAYVIATNAKASFLKKSSAAASFKAQQDLLENKRNFMHYDKELYDLVSNIKSSSGPKPGFIEKYMDQFDIYNDVLKDFQELKTYQKTTEKDQEKLRKALKYIQPTQEQLEDAERLQNSVFKMLDKMETLADKNYKSIEEKTEYFKKITDSAIKIVAGFMGLVGFVKIAKIDMNNILVKKLPFISLLKKVGADKLLKHSTNRLTPIALVLLPLLYLSYKLNELEVNSSKAVVMNAIEETQDPMYFVKKKSTL
ncbi:MAG: hypothetical protein AB7V50_06555 [Vampirovibrionia bacterium]